MGQCPVKNLLWEIRGYPAKDSRLGRYPTGSYPHRSLLQEEGYGSSHAGGFCNHCVCMRNKARCWTWGMGLRSPGPASNCRDFEMRQRTCRCHQSCRARTGFTSFTPSMLRNSVCS